MERTRKTRKLLRLLQPSPRVKNKMMVAPVMKIRMTMKIQNFLFEDTTTTSRNKEGRVNNGWLIGIFTLQQWITIAFLMKFLMLGHGDMLGHMLAFSGW
ncbi:hypothetical protein QL285_070049 [Trifolium repens]|nr:hypothetical protein QL285_070049 [Trifolium repens]